MTRGKSHAPRAAGDDTQLDVAFRHDGTVGRGAHIAHASQVKAQPDCRAVDRGDDQHFAFLNRIADHLESIAIGVARSCGEPANMLSLSRIFFTLPPAQKLFPAPANP